MKKTKRKYKSEINLIPGLQIEQDGKKGQKTKVKTPPSKALPQGGFKEETILGIIERIKKL